MATAVPSVPDNAVVTNSIVANNVTLAKLVAATAQGKLIGRKTALAGDWEEVAADGSTLEFPSAGGALGVKALGITAAQLAGDAVETLKIKDANVTYAKIQNVAANKVLGSAAGGAPSEIDCTAAGRALIDDASAAIQRATLDTLYRNLVINGDFRVAQRGTQISTPADDSYTLDCWNYLGDTANILASVLRVTTDQPVGAYASMKCTVGATQNKKWGFVTFLEARDAAALVGGVCSLQFNAKTTAAKVINKLRCGILTRSAAADVLTSDVVNGANWGASGANPTLVAEWAYANVPADISITTSWQTTRFKTENVSIPAGTTNIAVFIWVDDTDAVVNDELYIADVQLEEGAACTHYERRPYQQELALCQRYLQERNSIAPNSANTQFCMGFCPAATLAVGYLHLATQMRTIPTLSCSSLPMVDISVADGLGTYGGSAVTLNAVSDNNMARLDITSAGMTITRPCAILFNAANKWLRLSAEL